MERVREAGEATCAKIGAWWKGTPDGLKIPRRNIPLPSSREILEIPIYPLPPGWFGYIFKLFRHIFHSLGPYGSRKCRTNSNHTNLTRRIDPRSPEALATPNLTIFMVWDFLFWLWCTQLDGDRDLSPVSRGQNVPSGTNLPRKHEMALFSMCAIRIQSVGWNPKTYCR